LFRSAWRLRRPADGEARGPTKTRRRPFLAGLWTTRALESLSPAACVSAASSGVPLQWPAGASSTTRYIGRARIVKDKPTEVDPAIGVMVAGRDATGDPARLVVDGGGVAVLVDEPRGRGHVGERPRHDGSGAPRRATPRRPAPTTAPADTPAVRRRSEG